MMTHEQLNRRIRVAAGKEPADLVLANARIVNVFTNTLIEGDVAIVDGVIAGIGHYANQPEHVRDLGGAIVCPGLIDGHIHMESSMVTPRQFESLVLPHGTTCIIDDPHEIANVAGLNGINTMLNLTQNLIMDVFFMLPSCVPSSDLDESGAVITPDDLRLYLDDERVLGLAEVMDANAVMDTDESMLAKLMLMHEHDMVIDGHAPALSKKSLNGFLSAGIASDHECSSMKEALEKYRLGMWIMIREGTAAHNLTSLLPMFDPPYYQRSMLVTDDRHPSDILGEGHIDHIIRMAIEMDADPLLAIRMGSFNTAQYFGLKNRGAVAPGYIADLLILDELNSFNVRDVYKNGRLVVQNGDLCVKQPPASIVPSSIQRQVYHSFNLSRISVNDLNYAPQGRKLRVVQLMPDDILTTERTTDWMLGDDTAPGVDIKNDIIKMAVFERHARTGHVGIGFLGGYGLKCGAVATSIAHDSHNLAVVGTNDTDMVIAANAVRDNQGGFAIACHGRLVDSLSLPICGLMTPEPSIKVVQKITSLKNHLREWGIPNTVDPFMTLGFVCLPVIPALRINTHGVIDVAKHSVVEATFDE